VATVKFKKTTSERIDTIPISAGNLIFCEDTRTIFLDNTSERISYNGLIILVNDSQRESMTKPISTFYFVKETNVLWRYDGGWIQITEPPKTIIVYDNFPTIGEENVLYVNDNGTYRWIDNEYVSVSSKDVEWGEF